MLAMQSTQRKKRCAAFQLPFSAFSSLSGLWRCVHTAAGTVRLADCHRMLCCAECMWRISVRPGKQGLMGPVRACRVPQSTFRVFDPQLCRFQRTWHLQAWVHGVRIWVRTAVHMVDLVIICVSLALEVVALSTSAHEAAEVGGLLIVFRLWRVVRVMHAVGEVRAMRCR